MSVIISMLLVGGCQKDDDDDNGSEVFNGKVNVGGHQLYVKCAGEGAPAVILEAGGFDSFSDGAWANVYNRIADFTTVCAYDRAGYGKSELGPDPRSSEQIAQELHTLLQNLPSSKVKPPYILAGHSMGGFHIWTYANHYPSEIAGMAFVDSSYPLSWAGPLSADCESEMQSALFSGEDSQNPSPGEIADGRAYGYIYCTEAERLNSLPNVPVVALTHTRLDGDPEEAIQQLYAMHQKIVDLVSDGTHLTADAGHYIQHDDPNAVISAIRNLYNKTAIAR